MYARSSSSSRGTAGEGVPSNLCSSSCCLPFARGPSASADAEEALSSKGAAPLGGPPASMASSVQQPQSAPTCLGCRPPFGSTSSNACNSSSSEIASSSSSRISSSSRRVGCISSSSSTKTNTDSKIDSRRESSGGHRMLLLLLLLLLLGLDAEALKVGRAPPVYALRGPLRGPRLLFPGPPPRSSSSSSWLQQQLLRSTLSAPCSLAGGRAAGPAAAAATAIAATTLAAAAGAPKAATAAAAALEAAAGDEDLIRNVAIVAHVDHGKTTLVDALLAFAADLQQQQQQPQQHKKPPPDRQLDREELERERGITIRAKVASLALPLTSSSSSRRMRMARINLIDTPGHADFGGEVERVLHLADGVLLVGPKPQTRVVLEKALRAGLKAVVAVNKVDRPAAKPEEVASRVFDLFLQLDASDAQADFEVVYTSALMRQSGFSPLALEPSMSSLVSALLRLPSPSAAAAGAGAAAAATTSLQLQVAHVSEDPFRGRLVLGKLQAGALLPGSSIGIVRAADAHAAPVKGLSLLLLLLLLLMGLLSWVLLLPACLLTFASAVAALPDAAAATFTAVYRYEGLELTPVDPDLLQQQQQQQQEKEGRARGPLQGDLLVVGGLSEEVRVGDSLVDLTLAAASLRAFGDLLLLLLLLQDPRPLLAIRSEPPTVSVVLLPNSSPLAGKDSGQPTTILSLRDRLRALIRNDISAKIAVAPGGLRLSGRGPLHLAVLIETLRRQGVELAVAAPDILPRWSGSEWLEPYEDFEVTLPADALGAAMRQVQARHGTITEIVAGDADKASSSSSSSSSDSSSTLSFRVATRFSFGLKAALMEATKGAASLHSSPAGFLPLVAGVPPPRSARHPPLAAAAAAAAAGAAAAAASEDGGGEEDEEAALLQQQQQQQQQQRIPKEGEKQQGPSRSSWAVKRQVEGGDAGDRPRGFLVAVEAGNATVKGILHAQERGQVFVSPGDEVYPGMLVGIHKRPSDLPVNICKAKKLTNMRAATKSVSEGISPPLTLNLDSALDLIGPGEVVEVTPQNIRRGSSSSGSSSSDSSSCSTESVAAAEKPAAATQQQQQERQQHFAST
ncbi:hypothetical protein Efla_000296 [Eimeria flavescens]